LKAVNSVPQNNIVSKTVSKTHPIFSTISQAVFAYKTKHHHTFFTVTTVHKIEKKLI